MKSLNPLYSTPAAILVGSLIVAVAILTSGGIIKFGKVAKTTTPTAQAPSQPSPPTGGQAKTEADIVANLKTYASKVGLDQNKFNSCLDSGEKASLVKKDLDEGTTAGVNGTPAFFINGRLLPGAQPFTSFKQVIDEELSGSVAGTVTRQTVGVGDLPVLGSAAAKVTLIEFSDYQCPFCERYFTQTEGQIKKEYIDTGKVKFYYRDYPLSQIHPGAQKAAEAARCAGDQGKYWEYHDLIFQNQQNIF
ncbi:thioredoxin domain-containing protein [Candidatus Daviesbacteria bacterium]|nr:thioredoxin domain-containing protein [Candidatus Daviesbacteria bacterium]